MERLSVIEWAMDLAKSTATRSTCLSRKVGCVLLDNRNHVIGTGYNGSASGLQHCSDNGVCYKRAKGYASGTGDEICPAIHAEVNAVIQCKDVYSIHTVYVTTAPCHTCTKMLLSTNAQIIYYIDDYVSLSGMKARNMWENAGRKWIKLNRAPYVGALTSVNTMAPTTKALEHNTDIAEISKDFYKTVSDLLGRIRSSVGKVV